MSKISPLMKITKVRASPMQNPHKEQIYCGKPIPFSCIIDELNLQRGKDADRNWFYVVSQARVVNGEVEVTRSVYDLTDFETRERHNGKYYGDLKGIFPLNNAKHLDGFLDLEIKKHFS